MNAGLMPTVSTAKGKSAKFYSKVSHRQLERAMVHRPSSSKIVDPNIQQMELALEYVFDEIEKETTEVIPNRLKEAKLSIFERKLIHYAEIALTMQNNGKNKALQPGVAFSLSGFQTRINSNDVRKDNFSNKVKNAIKRIERLIFKDRWNSTGKNAINTGGIKAQQAAAALPTSIFKSSGGSYVKGDMVFILFDILYVLFIYSEGHGRIQPLPDKLLSVDGNAYLIGYYLTLYARGAKNSQRQKDGLFHYSFGELYDAAMGERPDWKKLNENRHVDREKKDFLVLIETLAEAGVLSTHKILYPHTHLKAGEELTPDNITKTTENVFESLILAYDIEGIDEAKATYLKTSKNKKSKQITQDEGGGNYLPPPDFSKKVGKDNPKSVAQES